MARRNRFQFTNLEELKKEIRSFPQDLAGEASHIVEANANAAVLDIKSAYPVRLDGSLRDGVSADVLRTSKNDAVGMVVKNTSPLAYIFENGTQARHTRLGAFRGSMPPGHVFIPRIIRHRRRMNMELGALLVRKGLEVSGDA